jgi:thiol-disulfide isomerase/thioredoxin
MKVIVVTAVWCHACLFMKKVLKAFVANHPEWTFTFLDLDLDEAEEKYNVGQVLPVLIFMQDDQEVFRIKGEKTLAELESESSHAR